MTGTTESDGKTVVVTTYEGHRIGFAMAEVGAASTSGEIKTDWAGVPPARIKVAVRRAKADAERHVAQHQASKPAEARAARDDGKGLGVTLEDMLGLP